MRLGKSLDIWRNRVEFCERYCPRFERMSNIDDNYPGIRISMFTILTQHIYARSVAEVIDMGILIEEMHKARLQVGIYGANLSPDIAESDTRNTVQATIFMNR